MLSFEEIRIIRDTLHSAQRYLDEIDIAVTRQSKFGSSYGSGGRSAGETPLYWNENASLAKEEFIRVATKWSRVVRCRCAPPKAPCRHRGWNLDDLKANSVRLLPFDNSYSEIVEATAKLRDAVDIPPARIYLGDCACGTRLYGNPEKEEMECPGCAREHNPKDLRAENQRRGEDTMVTAKDARAYIGEHLGVQMTKGRFNHWTQRGFIVARGAIPATGEKFYRLGDIVEYIERKASEAGPRSVRT